MATRTGRTLSIVFSLNVYGSKLWIRSRPHKPVSLFRYDEVRIPPEAGKSYSICYWALNEKQEQVQSLKQALRQWIKECRWDALSTGINGLLARFLNNQLSLKKFYHDLQIKLGDADINTGLHIGELRQLLRLAGITLAVDARCANCLAV